MIRARADRYGVSEQPIRYREWEAILAASGFGPETLRPVPGHKDSAGHEVGTFAALVNASRPSRFPAQQNGGVGGVE